jgi:hypothetical protein
VRLLVEFAGAAVEKWHLQYLQAAVHLLGLVSTLPAKAVTPSEAAPLQPDATLPDGWHRLVVRYMDGRLLKAYGREFTTASRSIRVWSTPGSRENPMTVPLTQVKAVFFVRDFAGDPSYVQGSAPEASARGRRVVVTFLDGETLVGATLNYNEHGAGFFLQPLDPGGNNQRVFVSSSAIRHVRS